MTYYWSFKNKRTITLFGYYTKATSEQYITGDPQYFRPSLFQTITAFMVYKKQYTSQIQKIQCYAPKDLQYVFCPIFLELYACEKVGMHEVYLGREKDLT